MVTPGLPLPKYRGSYLLRNQTEKHICATKPKKAKVMAEKADARSSSERSAMRQGLPLGGCGCPVLASRGHARDSNGTRTGPFLRSLLS
ncbi:hypothetical protein P7K49_009046, partial [Saguinus oedipus]